ncbi:10959_t:CDS:2 [Funneliformis mosseae]|uniref:10959_t:CDS:1 n=1 Tax=Funneliformis mosseae TaxID=27381 RepID=A0A9N9FDQ1_FUNMO|nr:10959_t:CDS:2 [Funneliformis mosseae]
MYSELYFQIFFYRIRILPSDRISKFPDTCKILILLDKISKFFDLTCKTYIMLN